MSGDNGVASIIKYIELPVTLIPVYQEIAGRFYLISSFLTIDDEFPPLAVELCGLLRSSHNGVSSNGSAGNGKSFYMGLRDMNRASEITALMGELESVRRHPPINDLVSMTQTLVTSAPPSIGLDLRRGYADILASVGCDITQIKRWAFFTNGTAKTTK